MIRHLTGICLAVFSLLVVMQPALGAAPWDVPVARVVWTSGTFKAGSRVLQRRSPVYVGDVLTTDASSQAEIVFSDNTLMTFKEGSKFVVDSYRFNRYRKTVAGNFAGTLVTGGFRTITGLIARHDPANYQINSPVATIGVRGTDYQVVYRCGYLYVHVYKGKVCITPHDALPSYCCCPANCQCPSGLYAFMTSP